MRLLHELRFRLKALFGRERLEQALDEEIQFHLERLAERYRSRGIPADEAMRMARVEFGGVEQIKEASRDSRGLRFIDVLTQDFRYAFRSLRRQPGFTVAIILTLGLGIGVNAVMFGILDQLLLRNPPMMQHADRVHRVYFGAHWSADEAIYSYSGYTRYLDLRNNTRSFDELAAWQNRTLSVGRGEATRELRVGVVTASFFNLFALTPAIGRLFTADEDRVPGGAPVAVLSYGYWQRQYGGAASVLGQTIDVEKGTYTIIGVLPQGFTGVSETGEPVLFVPLTSYATTFLPGSTWYTEYRWSWMEVLAKRKEGVSLVDAQRRSLQCLPPELGRRGRDRDAADEVCE